jgi:hypothetical protein
VEDVRVQKESKEREQGKRPAKSGPHHESQQDFALKKIALTTGVVAPSEVGLELEDKTDNQISMMEQRMNMLQNKFDNNNSPKPAGRPSGAKDNKQRTRDFKPKRKAVMEIWARNAQDKIGEIINPALLDHFGKANMRSLSQQETLVSENIRFGVLLQLEPFSLVKAKQILELLGAAKISSEIDQMRNLAAQEFLSTMKRSPTLEELRHIQSSIFAEVNNG